MPKHFFKAAERNQVKGLTMGTRKDLHLFFLFPFSLFFNSLLRQEIGQPTILYHKREKLFVFFCVWMNWLRVAEKIVKMGKI